MIKLDELTEIGQFYKPHGIKGELSAGFDYELSPDDLRCIIINLDGIFVPFFIEFFRPRGHESFLIKLEGIDNENEALMLAKQPIYALTSEIEIDSEASEDGFYLYDLIGYRLNDENGFIGNITDIDDSNENILIHVTSPDNKIVYIPFAEDWISEIDASGKTIKMTLPEGILTLN